MKKTLCFVAVSTLALAGCASSPKPQAMTAPGTCNPTKLPVSLFTVGSRIIPSEDPIIVCSQNVKISWVIDPNPSQDNYYLQANSIELKDGDPHDEFENCKANKGGELGNGNKEIKCHDKNNRRTGDYRYTIRVYKLGSPHPIELDPQIINN